MPALPALNVSLLASIASAFEAIVKYPFRVAAARRVMGQVGRMTDYELRDIGLTRQDLWDADTLPLGTDPGRLFQARVLERSGARVGAHLSKPTEAHDPARSPQKAMRPMKSVRSPTRLALVRRSGALTGASAPDFSRP